MGLKENFSVDGKYGNVAGCGRKAIIAMCNEGQKLMLTASLKQLLCLKTKLDFDCAGKYANVEEGKKVIQLCDQILKEIIEGKMTVHIVEGNSSQLVDFVEKIIEKSNTIEKVFEYDDGEVRNERERLSLNGEEQMKCQSTSTTSHTVDGNLCKVEINSVGPFISSSKRDSSNTVNVTESSVGEVPSASQTSSSDQVTPRKNPSANLFKKVSSQNSNVRKFIQ